MKETFFLALYSLGCLRSKNGQRNRITSKSGGYPRERNRSDYLFGVHSRERWWQFSVNLADTMYNLARNSTC